MKKLILYCIFLLINTLSLVSCKKGEEDPFLSLRTRKSRLTGEWKVSSYEHKEYTDDVLVVSKYFDGTNLKYTDDYSVSYSGEFTFQKDGTYESIVVENGTTETSKGNWVFLGRNKNGDVKNKEYLMLNKTFYSIENDFFGNFANVNINNFGYTGSISYKLIKLSNKEIIMRYFYEVKNDFIEDYRTEVTYTLIKK